MEKKITTPILLIGFNRPDVIKESFKHIRAAKPQKLYVAIDGPRDRKEGEKQLCKEVLEITKQVDWNCDVKYLVRKKNLGCKFSVIGAISWALEKEDRVIILEDDNVPTLGFFSFVDELLEKYKDDERIAMISANQYTPIESDDDYLFTKYGHIQGWATWKRVWDKFDINLPYLKNDIENDHKGILGFSRKEKTYIRKYSKMILSLQADDKINSWGPQFSYFRYRNNLLSIAPKVNLVSNIGTISSRTDSIAKKNDHYYPSMNTFVLSKHPEIVELNHEYDDYHFKKHINCKPSLIKRAFRKALRILNKK